MRNESALKFHNKLYEDLYYEPEAFDIRTKYPKYVVEWTPEEKRLMQLMKKQFE